MNPSDYGMLFFGALGAFVAAVWHPLTRREKHHLGMVTDLLLGAIGGFVGGLLSGFTQRSAGTLFVVTPVSVAIGAASALVLLAMSLYAVRLGWREAHPR